MYGRRGNYMNRYHRGRNPNRNQNYNRNNNYNNNQQPQLKPNFAGIKQFTKINDKSTSIIEVPELIYGDERSFAKYKEALEIYAGDKYGILVSVISGSTYPDVTKYVDQLIVMPSKADEDTVEAIKKRRDNMFDKLQEKLINDKISLYSLMYGKLSEGSKTEVHLHKDWNDAQTKKDPLTLWKIIQATHHIALNGIQAEDLYNIKNAYDTIAQQPNETLDAYIKRFRDYVQNIKDCADLSDYVPKEDQMAMKFIMSSFY